ncbi:integrase catalytic domain-containing protein [Trichonephila clavipes]|nr:integrase catalytic domain-containing protein [Trichonephila clavipes]
MNPADVLSRGCSPRHLLEGKWFSGREWLLGNAITFPTNELQCEAKVLDCTQMLISVLREKFWILRARTLRNIIQNSVKCKRYKAEPVKSESVSLPADRVRDADAFEVIGIDLAGPLFLKNGEKVWIVLYTCVVHLELVTALSTNIFLLCLRHFIARMDMPSVVNTNNGTNFRGAVREFTNLDLIKIACETDSTNKMDV